MGGDVDSVNGVLGIVKSNIWFLGDNGLSLCKAEKRIINETKVIIKINLRVLDLRKILFWKR